MISSCSLRILSIAAVLFLVTGAMARAQGKLEIVGGDHYDWGTVQPGKLTTTVEVKNVGTGDLKIVEVRPTCFCTVAPIDKDLLKPGEIAKIDVTMDVTTKTGVMERAVIIRSSDSSQPKQVLHLKATIKRDLTLSPSDYFIVIDARQGVESLASAISISNSGTEAVTIYPPDTVIGRAKVRLEMTEPKTLKPGEAMEVRAHITPLERDRLQGSVRLRTTSVDMPTLELKLSGMFLPEEEQQQQSHK